MSQNKFTAMLKAIATGDTSTAKEISDELSEAEHGALNVYATAVLSICLENRFREDSSVESIKRFVDELRYDFRNAALPIKPLMVEGVIRAFAGEEHLLDDIPAEEQLDAQYPIIRKIVSESDFLRDNLDAVLADAHTLVDSWTSEA